MNYKVPINKGNYDMDTPERVKKFDENRGAGWEDGYKEYRKNWSQYPETQYVPEYPLQVDIMKTIRRKEKEEMKNKDRKSVV